MTMYSDEWKFIKYVITLPRKNRAAARGNKILGKEFGKVKQFSNAGKKLASKAWNLKTKKKLTTTDF